MRATPVFAREPLRPAFNEAGPMLVAHQARLRQFAFQEVAFVHAIWDGAEAAGHVRTYTARVAGRLVGIAVFQTGLHLVYGVPTASALAICLEPAERRGWVGIRFLQFTEAQLVAEGVVAIAHETYAPDPALGRVLARLGYHAVGALFAKDLGGSAWRG